MAIWFPLAFAIAGCRAEIPDPLEPDDNALVVLHEDRYRPTFLSTRAAVKAGDVDAQFRLGGLYEKALGTEQNLAEAIAWYRRAALAGDSRAAFALGRVLQSQDLPDDQKEPPEPWILRAAEAGLADAQFAEAEHLLLSGRSQAVDDWLTRAADQGHPQAIAQLAAAQLEAWVVRGKKEGDGAHAIQQLSKAGDHDPWIRFTAELDKALVDSDVVPSDRNFRLKISDSLHAAALALDFEAQLDVGNHWTQQIFPEMALVRIGDMEAGINQLSKSAQLVALRPAAESGDLQSMCNYGYALLETKYDAEAFKWYRKAALRGSARAAYHLGKLYRDGRGVATNPTRAAVWFYRAAAQSYPPAQAALGDLLLRGIGVEQDISAALAWLMPSAAYGNPLAQYDLGLSYEKGSGVAEDFQHAAMLIARAAKDWDFPAHEGTSREGLPEAKDWLKAVEAIGERTEIARHEITKVQATFGLRPGVDSASMDCLGHTIGSGLEGP